MDFGELRSLAHGEPDARRWRAICEHLEELPEGSLREQVLPYLEDLLRAWPDTLRVMPPRWLTRLAGGQPEPRASIARFAIARGPNPIWESAAAGAEDTGLITRCQSCALAPDLSTLLLCDGADWPRGGGDVVLHDVSDQRPRHRLRRGRHFHGECYAARYTPDASLLAIAPVQEMTEGELEVVAAGEAEAQKLWSHEFFAGDWPGDNPASGDDWPAEHISVAIDPRGERVAGASKLTGEINVWSRSGRLLLALHELDAGPLPLHFSSDGEHLTTSHHDAGPTALAFSPDGAYLAVGYRTGMLRMWSLEEATIVAEARTEDDPIWRVGFGRDGTSLVAVSDRVHAWEWEGEELEWLLGHDLGAAAAPHVALATTGPDEVRVAALLDGEWVVSLDVFSGQRRRWRKQGWRLEAIDLTPDGRWLLGANRHEAWLWRQPE